MSAKMPHRSRPQSARTFSAKEYEDAKNRVRRLDVTSRPGADGESAEWVQSSRAAREKLSSASATAGDHTNARKKEMKLETQQTPPIDTLALVQGSTKQTVAAVTKKIGNMRRADADFVASLQRNIIELRECILGRLTPYPQLQTLLDGDFKEMQLHLDRLFIQNQTERERHEQVHAQRLRMACMYVPACVLASVQCVVADEPDHPHEREARHALCG